MKQTEEFIFQDISFEDFINMDIVKKAAIPEHYYRKIYEILTFLNPPVLNLPGEILIQWLTGEVQYFDKHMDMIEVFGNLMMFSACFSGQTDALDWLITHKLLQLSDNENKSEFPGSDSEYEIEEMVGAMLLLSKSITALQWGCKRNLIKIDIKTSFDIHELQWKEGFIWFNNTYPELIFKKSTIPQWYPERIFEILEKFENNEEQIRSLRSQQVFQFLTGDLEFYNNAHTALIDMDQNELNWTKNNMITGGLLSGETKAIDWLLEHQLLIPPENGEKIIKTIVYSKNIKVFAWLYENNFIKDTLMVCDLIMRSQWIDGFKWINDTIPEILSKAIVESTPSQFERKYYRPIHILAQVDGCILLEWCKHNKPHLLHLRDNECNTLAHKAANIGNVTVLRWFAENFSILLDCNDNVNEETIAHLGALVGKWEIINIGIAHNPLFATRKNIYGSNMPVYALNSMNPVLFNEVFLLSKNPCRINLNYAPRGIDNMLSTLNIALDTNFRLQFVDTPTKVCHENIENKLERNRSIYLVIIFLSGFVDKKSNLYAMPIEFMNLVCNAAMTPYLQQEVPFNWKREFFWNNNKVEKSEQEFDNSENRQLLDRF